MTTRRMTSPKLTIGLDLGDRFTPLCALDVQGRIALLKPIHHRGAEAQADLAQLRLAMRWSAPGRSSSITGAGR